MFYYTEQIKIMRRLRFRLSEYEKLNIPILGIDDDWFEPLPPELIPDTPEEKPTTYSFDDELDILEEELEYTY